MIILCLINIFLSSVLYATEENWQGAFLLKDGSSIVRNSSGEISIYFCNDSEETEVANALIELMTTNENSKVDNKQVDRSSSSSNASSKSPNNLINQNKIEIFEKFNNIPLQIPLILSKDYGKNAFIFALMDSGLYNADEHTQQLYDSSKNWSSTYLVGEAKISHTKETVLILNPDQAKGFKIYHDRMITYENFCLRLHCDEDSFFKEIWSIARLIESKEQAKPNPAIKDSKKRTFDSISS